MNIDLFVNNFFIPMIFLMMGIAFVGAIATAFIGLLSKFGIKI